MLVVLPTLLQTQVLLLACCCSPSVELRCSRCSVAVVVVRGSSLQYVNWGVVSPGDVVGFGVALPESTGFHRPHPPQLSHDWRLLTPSAPGLTIRLLPLGFPGSWLIPKFIGKQCLWLGSRIVALFLFLALSSSACGLALASWPFPSVQHWQAMLVHCFKWLKFNFCELENSRLFAEFLMPVQ